jgi:hypothetical protein
MEKNKKIGIGITVVLLIGVLVLGYLGFIPYLSDFLGVNNPINLNVKYTNTDFESARSKLGLTIDKTNPGTISSMLILDAKPVTTQLTSAEATALINYLADNWKDSPIDNVQMLINNDGTVEVSGIILTNHFNGFATAVDMTDSTRNAFAPILSLVTTNPSFYVKFSTTIKNGVVTSNINNIQVGKVSMSNEDVAKVQTVLVSYLTKISKPPVNHIGNLSFQNGNMIIDGVFPKNISLTPP